jgi:hypothetical protein
VQTKVLGRIGWLIVARDEREWPPPLTRVSATSDRWLVLLITGCELGRIADWTGSTLS